MAGHVLDTYGAATVRFLFLQGHYRRPNDFAPGALTAARTALGRLHQAFGALLDEPGSPTLAELESRPVTEGAAKLRSQFIAAMDEDFNTGQAIAAVFSLVSEGRKVANAEILRLARDLGRLIGLFLPGDGRDTTSTHDGASDETLDKVMALVLQIRQQARANRDFTTSDLIRDRLKEAGITVKDAKDGATWER